jgi:hypothetical protein
MFKRIFAVAAAIASLAAGPAGAVTIADGSFEAPAYPHGTFAYRPVASGIDFQGWSGIQANGSPWGFAPAPEGLQTAFLQSYNSHAGAFSLDVSGLLAGETYSFTFDAAQRPGYGTDPFTVSFNGIGLGEFSPSSTSWTSFRTATFTAAAGSGRLTFTGAVRPGDSAVGIDNVRLTAAPSGAPEPAAWFLMIMGIGGAGASLRRSRALGA